MHVFPYPPPFPPLLLIPLSLPLYFLALPTLPSLSPFNGGPGYNPGKNFKIADARRRDLAHSGHQNLLSEVHDHHDYYP
jgi:hypothetical protein